MSPRPDNKVLIPISIESRDRLKGIIDAKGLRSYDVLVKQMIDLYEEKMQGKT